MNCKLRKTKAPGTHLSVSNKEVGFALGAWKYKRKLARQNTTEVKTYKLE